VSTFRAALGGATAPEDIVFKLSCCGTISTSQNAMRSLFGAFIRRQFCHRCVVLVAFTTDFFPLMQKPFLSSVKSHGEGGIVCLDAFKLLAGKVREPVLGPVTIASTRPAGATSV
jgi:hypothetical protein